METRHKLLDIALGEYGITEILGNENNPRILQYFSEIGHSWVKDDETSWCSAFVNWVCLKAGADRSGALDARSWLNIGTKTTDPKPGDIVVLWRENPNSWKGHVGFFIKQIENYVLILGGNQSNTVKISSYPKYRVLSYRSL